MARFKPIDMSPRFLAVDLHSQVLPGTFEFALCLQNVLFMAVSGDTQPDHSTLAAFVSSMGDVVVQLFARVLVVCDRQGLIGRELFAIDGVKLPSNAAKARSGTREEFAEEATNMEAVVAKMIDPKNGS